MLKILMWLGGISAALGIFFFAMIAITSAGQGGAAIIGALGVGGGLILSGAVLYSFGVIVEHLIAIRKAAERQLEIFQKFGQPKV